MHRVKSDLSPYDMVATVRLNELLGFLDKNKEIDVRMTDDALPWV